MTDVTGTAGSFETSLGRDLVHRGSVWELDLTDLPIFHGLSVLSRALGEMVIAQAGTDRVDVAVEREVRPSENPELRDELGVQLVKLCAEHAHIAAVLEHPEHLQDHLRTILGTLQRPHYRDALMAEDAAALVFDLTFPKLACRFVLERVAASQRGRCFLRITVEDCAGRRLDLASVRHERVVDLDRRVFIAGSTRIAQTLADGIRREAERGRRSFDELRRAHDHLFHQFAKAGLDGYRRVHVSWGDAFVPQILEADPTRLTHLLKRVLLALEDRRVRATIAGGGTVRVVDEEHSVWVDESQLGRVLELSLGRRRERVDLAHFLERMPATTRVVQDARGARRQRPLAGVSVFLVHHMTAEVLGLIAALRELGCRDLVCVFVQYAGDPPGSYLGPLLELPQDEFHAFALTNVPEEGSVEGHYKLSTQYSQAGYETELVAALSDRPRHWFAAMQALVVPAFLRQLERARGSGRVCAIIEDGGYLAPLLHRGCVEGRRVADLVGAPTRDDRPLRTALDGVLLGSVEHTRNGFDRLAALERELGRLAFPSVSIAVSRLKLDVESREVAVSVLNAIENVLHARGRILSRRRCLVLGSRGSIGTRLVAALEHRLDGGVAQLAGVDLRAGDPGALHHETVRYRELPADVRLDTDLVIGVTGTSVLDADDLEEWLVHGRRPELWLASGSTKTVEFAAVAEWLERLLDGPPPTIGGRQVAIERHEVRDPLTGRVFAHRFVFRFPGDGRLRELVLLANLMPVNFMFYGVPTELIDEVLAELLGTSLGLCRRARDGDLPCRLLAVDRDVDARGEPLR